MNSSLVRLLRSEVPVPADGDGQRVEVPDDGEPLAPAISRRPLPLLPQEVLHVHGEALVLGRDRPLLLPVQKVLVVHRKSLLLRGHPHIVHQVAVV